MRMFELNTFCLSKFESKNLEKESKKKRKKTPNFAGKVD